jgi:hypothetical protein
MNSNQFSANKNNEENVLFSIDEGAGDVFISAVILFIPFFIFRIGWGLENQFQSLFLHIPQAVVIAVICLISIEFHNATKRQTVIFVIFTFLLLIHILQTDFLVDSLPNYDYEYFIQGVLLWAYLFAVCLYASTIEVENYQKLLYFFDLFAKTAVVVAILSFMFYKITDVSVLIHFYDGFGLARLQGFFSEPSAFAPVSCWLLMSGVKNSKLTNIGLAITACVLASSPIVIISTLLALGTYLMIFHPRITPLILVATALTAAYVTLVDCSINYDGSSISRALCGAKTVFSEDARAVFSNDRIISSIAIFDHLSATNSLVFGLGINSASVFMPAYYGEMRDNSLPISIFASYGVLGVLVFVCFAIVCITIAWQRKNIYTIFWISFFWCSIINSAQGFISYALFFAASIWLLSYPNQKIIL